MTRPIIWKENQLEEILGKHPDIYGVCFDSRLIQPGDAFFALRGVRDGHDFVQQAFQQGACCAVVERVVCENNIVVPNVLDALYTIASKSRAEFDGKVIAITGSVGKTTSKFALQLCMEEQGVSAFCAPKSYNNILGVLWTLCNLPPKSEVLIVEIGTSNPGEIAELTQFVKPHYSLLTHIAPAHIVNFGSLKNILLEKADIIKYTQQVAFFNGEMWYTPLLKKWSAQWGVGCKCFANVPQAMDTMQNAWQLILAELGLRFEKSAKLHSLLNNVEGRRNVFEAKNVTVIDSAYNANLASMIESIKFLQSYPGRKIAILADMLALDEMRGRRFHEALSCYLKDVELLSIGENMQHLAKKMNGRWFQSFDELMACVKAYDFTDATVLIKGSSDGYRSVNDLSRLVAWFATR